MESVTYEGIVKYMNSMEFSGMKLGIERIKKALSLFGNPEKRLKIINIVGTNGKGSVAAMLSKILEKAGHKVGMFTSPHLVDVRERIQVNNKLISKDEFKEAFVEAKSKLAELTFFELVTLMAVLHFVRQKVDYAVFEAGLGGTYDATNFDSSLMSVVTSISLDHTHILGETVEKITRDKCGMIKPGNTVITTEANSGVMRLIEEIAGQKDARLVVAGSSEYETLLKGQFQKENAGVAVQAAGELGIDERSIKQGLLEAQWPGRIEWLEKNILMDCAHNTAGVAALRKYIETLDYENIIFVFAACKNKDYRGMLELLPEHKELIFTQTSIERRLSIEEIPREIKGTRIKDPVSALEHAKSLAGEKDLIVLCGTIFLVADIKAALAPELVKDAVA
jgi:dihydrofolate synthase/folylpolyglutamate synthase